MKWPNHTDYQDAIQNPQVCFEEPELKAGQAECDMLGLPRVMSGNFASVYELAAPGKRHAVRCFVRQVSGTQARYARLGQHLSSVSVPWLVGFEYIHKGILVQGEWYPIVKMEWVAGCPINNYIEQHLREPETLLSLAAQFRRLVADLRQHHIAHGDLQHGNIMVTPGGELRLVDYDGMYCPAFGKGRSPELGHANFQHPLRMADFYDEALDNFSALVIYTSLLALAAEPALWETFYSGDNLLLSSSDFRDTQNSKAFARLLHSSDPRVCQLAAVLQKACRAPVAQAPWFEETLVAIEKGMLKLDAAENSAAAVQENKSGDWWANSQAHTTFTQRASAGTRAASRPSPPVPEAPAVTGTRPASTPTPAPAPIQHAYGTPLASIAPSIPSEKKESSLAFKLAVAIGLVAIIGILWYALAAERARALTTHANPPPAASENP